MTNESNKGKGLLDSNSHSNCNRLRDGCDNSPLDPLRVLRRSVPLKPLVRFDWNNLHRFNRANNRLLKETLPQKIRNPV